MIKFILCCITLNLSDNLTELHIVKNSNVKIDPLSSISLNEPRLAVNDQFRFCLCYCCFHFSQIIKYGWSRFEIFMSFFSIWNMYLCFQHKQNYPRTRKSSCVTARGIPYPALSPDGGGGTPSSHIWEVPQSSPERGITWDGMGYPPFGRMGVPVQPDRVPHNRPPKM